MWKENKKADVMDEEVKAYKVFFLGKLLIFIAMNVLIKITELPIFSRMLRAENFPLVIFICKYICEYFIKYLFSSVVYSPFGVQKWKWRVDIGLWWFIYITRGQWFRGPVKAV